MIDLFSRVPIDTKSDIWALGVLLFKLCYFSLPFGESALAIQSGLFTFPETPKDITSEVKAIINLCMTQSARYWLMIFTKKLFKYLRHRPNIYQISYLAFSASGRKCPVYNIEKSSRIEVPEAVQILQLREKIGTNYARAFERAIDEFEEQKQRRDAQGRAQLIAAKLLGSPFPNQKNTEQANGMDSRRDNVGRSENTTVSMTSQNQHFHGDILFYIYLLVDVVPYAMKPLI